MTPEGGSGDLLTDQVTTRRHRRPLALAGSLREGDPARVEHLADDGEASGGPPRRRGDSAFTDRFGRALPSLSGGRRKP